MAAEEFLKQEKKDATFSWRLPPLDEARFHARACMLAVASQQQDITSLQPRAPVPNGCCDQEEMPEEWEDGSSDWDSDINTVVPRTLVMQKGGRLRLKEKFLDRIAELLARQKTCREEGEGSHERQDADHVAAAVMVEYADKVTMYVAKNGGFDRQDLQLRTHLERWLRAVASAGYRPNIDKDTMWKEMLVFWSGRLHFYRRRVLNLLQHTEFWRASNIAVEAKLAELLELCRQDAGPGQGSPVLSKIVRSAYALRYDEGLTQLLRSKETKAAQAEQCVALLGRLRAIFDTLVECAMRERNFQALEIIRVSPDIQYDSMISNVASLKFPTNVWNGNKALKKKKKRQILQKYYESLYVHAEVQLILYLEQQDLPNATIVKYLGCSKKTCYLCCRILTHLGSFRNRGTHGKVYWRWTIREVPGLSMSTVFKIQATLLEIENEMIERFEEALFSANPALVAETVTEISMKQPAQSRLEQLGFVRSEKDVVVNEKPRRDAAPMTLGKLRGSIQAVRIPADVAEPIEIVRLNTHEVLAGYHCIDKETGNVPDFSEYWGEVCTFDRSMHLMGVENQNPRTLEGEYRTYWNTNPELPGNEHLKQLLIGLKRDIPPHRRFWYGDVFLVKVAQKDGRDLMVKGCLIYEDVPAEFVRSQLLKVIFRKYWEVEFLEHSIRADAEGMSLDDQWGRDRELILARMYVDIDRVLRSRTNDRVKFWQDPYRARTS